MYLMATITSFCFGIVVCLLSVSLFISVYFAGWARGYKRGIKSSMAWTILHTLIETRKGFVRIGYDHIFDKVIKDTFNSDILDAIKDKEE